MRAGRAMLVAAALSGVATTVQAQSREPFVLSINGAFQATRTPFTDRFDFEVNRETATTETHYPTAGGLTIDGSAVVNLFQNVGLGVAVSQFTREDVVSVESRVPHPFMFDTPREVSGETGATRRERAVHVQAVYRFGIARSIKVMVFGGPSVLRLEQDIVTSIRYDESFPYDMATFRSAETRRVSGQALGFNAGADVTWMFTRHVGAGALARVARATIELDLPGARTRAVEAGGVAAGAGLRVVF